MINTPIDNFVYRALATKTIYLDSAIKELDESQHVIHIEFVGSDFFLLIIENHSISCIIKLNDVCEFLGSKSLELVRFRLQREQSRFTIGKISKHLQFLYEMLSKSQPVLKALNTNYFSFWRFVSTIKEDNSYGLCSLHNANSTLWAIFEAGELSGGWLCKSVTEEPVSLSVDRVLEEAVRIAGLATFYCFRNRIIFDVAPETIFEKKQQFQRLLEPDSMARLSVKKDFGEYGFTIATQFDGKKTVGEVAELTRVSFEKTRDIAKRLYELDIIGRL